MSERRLMQYASGDEIEVLLRIRHAPMRLREATLRFFPEGEELTTEFVSMSGMPRASEDNPQGQVHSDPMISEVRMPMLVGADLPPGDYRRRWVTVTTSEGREYGYSDEDLGYTKTDPLGFEMVEKADDKPALSMTISLD
jgi:hypothetical protein